LATENSKATDEAQIRKLMDDRARAVQAKDINGLMSNYAPDVLSFDAVDRLQNSGSDGSRKRAREWFSAYQGPIGSEMRELSIAMGDDVAFCHGLNRIRGTTTNGTQVDMWLRATVCLRKIGGKWLITHEHTSAPFDAASGRALSDLKPADSRPATGPQDAAGRYASVNGLNMYYEVHGAGRPLVLLHGALSAIGTSFGKLLRP
jgi:ketosteroid isomerase-like protein